MKAMYEWESVFQGPDKQQGCFFLISDVFSLLFLPILSQANYVKTNYDKDTDVVTGLKQKTHYGRPNWDKEFEQVRKENPK